MRVEDIRSNAVMNGKVTAGNLKALTPGSGNVAIGARLAGAIIEASHDDKGIIWPDAVAPYAVGLVNMRDNDAACVAAADDLYAKLNAAGVEPLYDDRALSGGQKLATMDVIGLPWQIVIGPKGLERGVVELKRRATGETVELAPDDAVAKLGAQ
jgi:prolyl-tRNA synthetase